MASTPDRVVILGLDGATWTVLDRMIERGYMPHLASLLKRSAYGTSRSTIPPVTSAAWTTMMTGCDPERHGVFDHRYYDAAAGQMKVNHSGRVRVPTFWHLLSRAGRSVVSLNLPVTYPPLDVNGIIVSGMDAPHLEAALSGATAFGERLRAEVPNYSLRVVWKRPPRSLDEIRENAQATVDLFHARAEGGLLADRMLPDWSALMVQFQNLDPFQHRVWKYLNVDETGIDDPLWNGAAGSVMTGLDAAIGMLCELADRRGAAVVAASDHGFGPCSGRIDVNRILIDRGVARLPGVAGRLGRRVRQGADRLRLWSAKRGDPHARAASFAASITAQYPLDWNKTLAFAPHQDTAAMIYINSSDRHQGAPIKTSRQVDEALSATAAALSEARHPENSKPLFPKIVQTAEAYGIDPAREGYPDLIALPDEMYWVRTKLNTLERSRWVIDDPNLPGTHRPEGIVAIAAAGVTPGKTLSAELRDIAPTILNLLGEPIPEYIQGKPIVAAKHPLAGHKTRTDGASSGYTGPHKPQFDYTAEEQAVIEKRLAELGYLE